MLSESQSTLVDLRVVQAPYVRLMGQRMFSFSGSALMEQWELRFTQPNLEHLSPEAMHSLEHLLARHLVHHLARTMEVSAMACATGFRVLIAEELTFEQATAGMASALEDILLAEHVPASEPWRCGYVNLHSLEGAQNAAANFLAGRSQWGEVVPLAK